MSASVGRPSDAVPSTKKPRLAVVVATALGLGYLPKAPGTLGSLAGLALAQLPPWALLALVVALDGFGRDAHIHSRSRPFPDPVLLVHLTLALLLAVVGIWSAGRAARFWQKNDPQWVVIDEVSGQHLALLLGCVVPIWPRPTAVWSSAGVLIRGIPLDTMVLNWKYLILGFILFRAFDIWKPFPARQAESLSGGWGIMADDWVAGIYAAIGLWLARVVGL